MRALRPLLWRQARRITRHPPGYGRRQHDQYGPHKEYFQTPGQMPIPEPLPYQHVNIPHTSSVPSGPSLLTRAFRSVFWVALSGTIGFTAGTALITWEYMQPPFEPGSIEDQELLDEISDTLESHPLVESLRGANWIEENFYAGRVNGPGKGLNFVSQKLAGTQGITMKTFKHPSQKCTMLVFFLGFGMEGWPDVIHGGIVATLVQEGVDQHLHNFYQDHGNRRASITSIDFKKPMRPGDIYGVFVPPAEFVSDPSEPEVQLGRVLPLVLNVEAPPQVMVQFDEQEKIEQHIIDLHSSDAEGSIHAVATIQVQMVQPHVDEARLAEIDANTTIQSDHPWGRKEDP
ncbi:uncharacterized protein Z518_01306 [Rhinocladiella mackenziei CBS 650.93]|uniref:Rhinocladiella mackenziei CBS 650.93 unplaced genomic scaffold supercont1.1, whole genome shotgun sequence n=1 Tax=Rhinocladiella mackenziei CBS 650.93 TaxID=1442369 RepID=A0A0D2JL83_9EURO|nr:uncharacterized protein Z518_01306 [Rhinocladiella mackenziei CBS 650.93]KIX10225.1 hypothetical protein Z518_01306 [Rhinocladiella mackenziei CBS 650.93]